MRFASLMIYGIAVIASGCWRFLTAEGGHTGLIFGIVMGLAAILASVFWRFGHSLVSNILAWLTVAMVGGWFGYEALIKKGIGVAEPRQLIIIGLSVVVAIVLLTSNGAGNQPGNKKPEHQSNDVG